MEDTNDVEKQIAELENQGTGNHKENCRAERQKRRTG
jgi:hypothetical protein